MTATTTASGIVRNTESRVMEKHIFDTMFQSYANLSMKIASF